MGEQGEQVLRETPNVHTSFPELRPLVGLPTLYQFSLRGARGLEINEIELRVRDLCNRLTAAVEEQEILSILNELQDAIREHTEAVRQLAVASMKGISTQPREKPSPEPDSTSKAAD